MEYTIKQIPEDFLVEEIPWVEDKGPGKYSYWWLQKKNYNTLAAVREVSKTISVPMKLIGWAGNKDKNAVTKQLISIQTGKNKISNFESDTLKLTYFGSGNDRIYIGNLQGNKFTVVIRNLNEKDATTVEARARQLKTIPNYFDEQRFGETNIAVGTALINHDFKEAAKIIYREEQQDSVGAIQRVHSSTLSMYMHAYQSLLWNEMVAQYIQTQDSSAQTVVYKHGEFVFPHKTISNKKFPLIGFATEIADPIVEKVMHQHSVTPRSFVIKQLPTVTVEGTTRDAIVSVENLHSETAKDELNDGKKKITLTFSLPKASYATMVVKALTS